MNQIQSAALMLTGVTLAFLAIVFAIWWYRRPRAAPTIPAPRVSGESRVPKLSRKSRPEPETVEMAPSRLARISRKTSFERLHETEFDPVPVADVEPTIAEDRRDATVSEIDVEAHRNETEHADDVSLRLVPQIPRRDAISTNSWIGGRPRLPAGVEWPKIDDQPADFLAQIDCGNLPKGLWDGLGPRDGTLAFFIHRSDPAMRVLHLRENGAPVAAPFTLNPEAWLGAHGGLSTGDLASFATRAFPEWPIDLVVVGPHDTDPRRDEDPNEPGSTIYNNGYDIADPAFHPFDWGSMNAMVTVLELRLDRLVTEAAPSTAADEDEVDEIKRRAAINLEARERALEIIAIVRDSPARDDFSPNDAMAVMAGLHAIHWAAAVQTTDPETGEARTETITLPLTTHRADANLWVHDYQTILFDRVKHAWCVNPGHLSGPTRAFYEPWWRELADREMAAMGHEPFRHIHDFDEERDVVLIELPTSGLMSRKFGDNDNLVVTIDKADLAVGDFSKLRAQISS